jgi:phosphatidylglycerophosphate synthase
VRIADEGARAHDGTLDAPLADGSPVILVASPTAWRRDGAPGGLSLLERLVKQLGPIVPASAVLLVPGGDPDPELPAGCASARIVRVPATARELASALAAVAHLLPETVLALSAEYLIDPRVLRALVGGPATTFVAGSDGAMEPIGWVLGADVRRHGAALAAHAERLLLATLDPYSPELRGDVAPYVLRCRSADEQRRAWSVLLDHVQKRALDLPGQYFDPPFENFLVRRFAPTNVTPNQITLATLVVAAVVAALFAHGWLRIGVLLALVVGVLDGVDGKLARLKLATSKLGELEHVGDFFYENGWYLALASHFQAVTQRAELWYAGCVLVACDLADGLLYLVVRRHSGRMLDELSAFDRRFRAIAGRRNVYVMTFVAGFFTGRPIAAFLGAVLWASVTVGVHAARVVWVLRTTPSVAVT